jgi:Undecaprenyl-phosphate galactose phosphotransferase WbaP
MRLNAWKIWSPAEKPAATQNAESTRKQTMFAAKQELIASSSRAVPHVGACFPLSTLLCIVASDVIALAVVILTLVAGRHVLDPTYNWSAPLRFMAFLALMFPAFLSQKLYPGLLIHPAEEMRRVFYSLTLVFLVWASAAFLWRTGFEYSRSVYLLAWALSAPAIIAGRQLTRMWFGRRSWWGVPAVILGSGPTAQRIARKLRDGKLGLKVEGVFGETQILSWEHGRPPVLGDLAASRDVWRQRVAEYAIVATPYKSNLELRGLIEDYCRGFRHVLVVPDMPGICSLDVTAHDIDGELGLEVPQKLFHPGSALAKRVLDCAASTCLLIGLSPVFALIAVAIKLTSRGPVFFGHMRHGRNGEAFQALKFRTMVANADHVLADYLSTHTESVNEWQRDQKLRNDPRITQVGKWLRRSSLDELPQMINVLRGQMSLVGPRPIVKSEIFKYGRGYELYKRVLPGLTGLWQVSGRNNTTYDERVAYDERYVLNWSVWLDLYILVRTIKVVITAEGAY